MSLNLNSNSFPPVDFEKWKKLIEKDFSPPPESLSPKASVAAGSDHTAKWAWKSWDSIEVQPFYQQKDYVLDLGKSYQDQPLLGVLRIIEKHKEMLLEQAQHALQCGASGIELEYNADNKSEVLKVLTLLQKDFSLFILRISPNVSASDGAILIQDIKNISWFKAHPPMVKIFFNQSIASNFALQKSLSSLSHSSNSATVNSSSLGSISSSQSSISCLGIDLLSFNAQGVNAGLELGYALAQTWENFVWAKQNGFDWKSLLPHVHYYLGLNPHFFAEIAKLRALRLLWCQLLDHFAQVDGEKINSQMAPLPYIHTCTSPYYQTDQDPYNNLLRTTTESMSALIGSASSHTVLPFDWSLNSTNLSAQRLAINIVTIIKEEAHFEQYGDVAAGNYYLSQLCWQLMEQGWNNFTRIEALGGWSEYIHSRQLTDELKKIQKVHSQNLQSNRDILLGVNKYVDALQPGLPIAIKPNLSPEMKDLWELRLALENRKIAL